MKNIIGKFLSSQIPTCGNYQLYWIDGNGKVQDSKPVRALMTEKLHLKLRGMHLQAECTSRPSARIKPIWKELEKKNGKRS